MRSSALEKLISELDRATKTSPLREELDKLDAAMRASRLGNTLRKIDEQFERVRDSVLTELLAVRSRDVRMPRPFWEGLPLTSPRSELTEGAVRRIVREELQRRQRRAASPPTDDNPPYSNDGIKRAPGFEPPTR